MREIKILEEEQNKSFERLQRARQKKEQAMEQCTKLNEQLGTVKYQHGQMRGELERVTQLVEKGIKKLQASREGKRSVEDAVKEFHRYVLAARNSLGLLYYS